MASLLLVAALLHDGLLRLLLVSDHLLQLFVGQQVPLALEVLDRCGRLGHLRRGCRCPSTGKRRYGILLILLGGHYTT